MSKLTLLALNFNAFLFARPGPYLLAINNSNWPFNPGKLFIPDKNMMVTATFRNVPVFNKPFSCANQRFYCANQPFNNAAAAFAHITAQ